MSGSGGAAWIDLIGMGADGVDSLAPSARAALESAETVFGSERLLGLLPGDGAGGERVPWPRPFQALTGRLQALQGRPVAVLATGDPLWFSVGTQILRDLGPDAVRVHPQVSAFQLACARLGWPIAEVETLTVHGRPVEQILPAIGPGARLLVLSGDGETPAAVARLLTDRGYGPSVLTALSEMGGPAEARQSGLASGWARVVPGFHLLAVECVADDGAQVATRAPGLADDVYNHDGQITKREVRAVTLAKLMPQPGALLWDVGAGCGSVGIEWMRAARDARAIGIDPDDRRRSMAAENARALGVPGLDLIAGLAPDVFDELPRPDAVFLGGGLRPGVAEAALAALKPLGRLVANGVTLETEAALIALHTRLGGELTRISVARARPVGGRTGWGQMMPVTQWSVLKR